MIRTIWALSGHFLTDSGISLITETNARKECRNDTGAFTETLIQSDNMQVMNVEWYVCVLYIFLLPLGM